jgi:hypothetical protein
MSDAESSSMPATCTSPPAVILCTRSRKTGRQGASSGVVSQLASNMLRDAPYLLWHGCAVHFHAKTILCASCRVPGYAPSGDGFAESCTRASRIHFTRRQLAD